MRKKPLRFKLKAFRKENTKRVKNVYKAYLLKNKKVWSMNDMSHKSFKAIKGGYFVSYENQASDKVMDKEITIKTKDGQKKTMKIEDYVEQQTKVLSPTLKTMLINKDVAFSELIKERVHEINEKQLDKEREKRRDLDDD